MADAPDHPASHPNTAPLGSLAKADRHDGKFTRSEATGVDLAINGLVEATLDDHELLDRGVAIFEGLYAVLKRKA